MYLFYLESFRYLAAYEVALFTIFTPIYIVLIYDILKRKMHLCYLISAILAVLGTFVILYRIPNAPYSSLGFLFVKISNLAFALGLIGYKLLDIEQTGLKQHQVFGVLFLGGVLVALCPC